MVVSESLYRVVRAGHGSQCEFIQSGQGGSR